MSGAESELLSEWVTNAVRHSGVGPEQSLSGTSVWCESGAEA